MKSRAGEVRSKLRTFVLVANTPSLQHKWICQRDSLQSKLSVKKQQRCFLNTPSAGNVASVKNSRHLPRNAPSIGTPPVTKPHIRTLRKAARNKTTLPHSAESRPRQNQTSARCGKLARNKIMFPHGAENRPRQNHASARCGKSPAVKTRFRTVRKVSHSKNTLPYSAESPPNENRVSALCGKSPVVKMGFLHV